MKDVMIDLETFDTSYHAAICQFGGVHFNRNTGELGDELLLNIDAGSCAREGLILGTDTVYWWLSQNKEAQQSILKEPRYNIKNALNQINSFLKNKHIWSHATFDFTILVTAFDVCRIKKKFHYRDAKDIRTLIDLAGSYSEVDRSERKGTHHNALDDAKFQVKYCCEAIRRINGNKTTN